MREQISVCCSGRAFWTVFALKIICGSLMASHYLRDLFVPFVRFFVESGFANPWDEFLRRGAIDAFPYSSTMLAAFTVPQVIVSLIFRGSANIPDAVQLLIMRVPLLVSDLIIYFTLCRWFGESSRRSVLLVYWCSPILFFISYVYGHFDVIPTAFLFLSISAALDQRPSLSGLFLGLGIGAKFHLAAAAPLLAFYLWKNAAIGRRRRDVAVYLSTLAAVVFALIAPLLGSEGYRTLVLGAKESKWIMDVAWTMPNGARLLICPAALVALILHFFSYQRVIRDVLVLYIGLLYAVIIVLVPPMTGWGYWCVPFLCFFLIRQDAVRYAPFWAYTAAYLVYFGFLAKDIAFVPLERWSLPLDLSNARFLVFTGMQTSLALVAVWVYRIGIRSYAQYKSFRPHVAVGIAGDSGSGKHTLAASLAIVTGLPQTVRLHGDDYHRWPRGHEAWETLTHLDPRSNYFRQPIQHIHELKSGQAISTTRYDHASGTFTDEVTLQPGRFVLFEGLHPFVFQRMRDAFDIKIFLGTDENLRRYWKVGRDTKKRGYSVEKVMHEIERRSEDARRYVAPQAEFADWVIEYFTDGELDPATPVSDLRLRARHSVSNRIMEIEGLVDEFSKYNSEHFHVNWFLGPDLKRQIVEVDGKLAPSDVARIALNVFPDLFDWLKFRPEWQSDMNGVNQLMFIALLRDAMAR